MSVLLRALSEPDVNTEKKRNSKNLGPDDDLYVGRHPSLLNEQPRVDDLIC